MSSMSVSSSVNEQQESSSSSCDDKSSTNLKTNITTSQQQQTTTDYGSKNSPSTGKHCLVLDVDHTFLSGLTEEQYNAYSSTSSFCQSLKYDPEEKRKLKYIKRALNESSPDFATGKMVHYKIPNPDDGKSLTFFVAIRPCITYLVSRHEMFDKEKGNVTILLASANDDERTSAVFEYLTFEGRTLKEISHANFIPREVFLDNYKKSRSGKKRIDDIRRWAEERNYLNKNGKLIFLDDKAPNNCIGTVTKNDYPCFISSWDLPESLQILEEHKQNPNIDRVYVPAADAALMRQVVQTFEAE